MGPPEHTTAAPRPGRRRLSAARAERLRARAQAFAPGAAARLVLPGSPAFVCLADECGALCCRAPYRVDVDQRETARLIPITDIEERGSLALLAQSDEGACLLLSPDLRCRAYDRRPRGCVQYPYLLHIVDARGNDAPNPASAVETWAAGGIDDHATPLLLRDPACPGFVGDPLTAQAWGALLRQIWNRGTD